MGKTQFCLCMAVISCLDSTRQGKVLYIDTESKFSGERLVEIARKRFPESFYRKGSMEDMLDRIIVKVPSSSSDLLQILQVRSVLMNICLDASFALFETVVEHKSRSPVTSYALL